MADKPIATNTMDMQLNGVDTGRYGIVFPYTTSWTGTITNPALGNGTLSACYSWLGRDLYVAQVNLTIGSTTTFGSGSWMFSLPFTAGRASQGSAYLLHSGSAIYVGVPSVGTAGTALFIGTNAGLNVTPTVPFTWTTNDSIQLTIIVFMR